MNINEIKKEVLEKVKQGQTRLAIDYFHKQILKYYINKKKYIVIKKKYINSQKKYNKIIKSMKYAKSCMIRLNINRKNFFKDEKGKPL